MVESASQDFINHILLLLHFLHLLQTPLLHWKIHLLPQNPIILCISWVAADNSGTHQLTKMILLTLNPRSSVIIFSSVILDFIVSHFNFFLISEPSSSFIIEQGEDIVVQSVFIWAKQRAKWNSRDTPGSKAMTPDPTASTSRHQIKRRST